jgi:hypothetical protein
MPGCIMVSKFTNIMININKFIGNQSTFLSGSVTLCTQREILLSPKCTCSVDSQNFELHFLAHLTQRVMWPDKKLQVLRLHQDGFKKKQKSERSLDSRSAVSKLKKKIDQWEHIENKPRTGRPKPTTPHFIRKYYFIPLFLYCPV